MDRIYRQKLDCVRLSTSGKQRLITELATGRSLATPRPRRVLRTGLLSAVMAGLLTVVAGAALIIAPVLRDYYGGAGYEQSASALGRSVTHSGWTLTLTDCIGDNNYLFLGLSMTAPKGTQLDQGQGETYNFKDYNFLFDNMEHQSMAWLLRQVPDDNTTDNSLHFVLWIETRSDYGSLNGRELELSIGNLYHFGAWNEAERNFEYIYDCEETWNFGKLTLNYPDNTIRLTPNIPVSVLDVTATLTTIEVSPIGVTVQIQGEGLKGHHKAYNSGYCIALPEITLYGKDGKALTPDKDAAPFGVRGGSGCGGGSNKTEEGFLRIVQSYGYLLDLDTLDHIEVCGVSIPF